VNSDISRAVNVFRNKLTAGEAKAVKRITGVYSRLYQVNQAEIALVLQKIRQMEKAGIEPTELQRRTLQMLSNTREELVGRMAGLTDEAINAGIAGQVDMIQTTNQAITPLVQSVAPTAEAGALFTRLNHEQTVSLIAQLDSQPLRETFAKLPNITSELLQEFLVENLVSQRNPRQLAREFGKLATDIPRQKVELIARTELLRASREASRHVYEENDVVMGYQRQCAEDDRTCIACLALSGTIYSKREMMPTHPMCRCVMIPILPTEAWFMGDDEFAVPELVASTGEEIMAKLTDDEKRTILGPTRLDLWKNEKYPLRSMVDILDSPKWGPQVRIKPIAKTDGTITIPGNSKLHEPSRVPVSGPIVPPAPPAPPTPPVVPPTPPVIPPTVPPVVPPKRPRGRPPKPKPPVPPTPPRPRGRPPKPKPPVPPTPPRPRGRPPKVKPPVPPSAPVVPKRRGRPPKAQPVNAPSPQSLRARPTNLTNQSTKNPYRWFDTITGRYIVDSHAWIQDYKVWLAEYKKDTDATQAILDGLNDEYKQKLIDLRAEYDAGRIPSYQLFREQREKLENEKYARTLRYEQELRTKKEEFAAKLHESLKADTPFDATGKVRFTGKTKKGTKEIADGLQGFFNIVEDRKIQPVQIDAVKTISGGANGYHQWRPTESLIVVKDAPDMAFATTRPKYHIQTAWHEMTHHLHEMSDIPSHLTINDNRGGAAAHDAKTLWLDITKNMTQTKTWCGRTYEGFKQITRTDGYGGKVYDWEDKTPGKPMEIRGRGIEMLTTTVELLYAYPDQLVKSPETERIVKFVLEYIL
jgi:SPP1 gp7 family putative phage head morphogenesis protein